MLSAAILRGALRVNNLSTLKGGYALCEQIPCSLLWSGNVTVYYEVIMFFFIIILFFYDI